MVYTLGNVYRKAIKVAGSVLAPPVLTYDTEAGEWILEEPYTFTHDETRLDIPAGFRFDLASIPRALWWAIAPFELSIVAPLLHDYLYRYQGEPPRRSVAPYRTWTRKEADVLFRKVMAWESVPSWRRWSAYLAVRAFGGGAWDSHAEAKVAASPE